MWHKIEAQLKLKLAYKNESNIKSTYEFDSNFNYNYANEKANLRKLINASTAKVEEKLKNFTIEVPANTSDSGLNIEVKKILDKIANDKVKLDMFERYQLVFLRDMINMIVVIICFKQLLNHQLKNQLLH